MRRAASEFPNDNPELHDGLVWTAPTPCGHALPTLRLRAPAGPAPKVIGPPWLPSARSPVEVAVAAEPAPAAEPSATVFHAEFALESEIVVAAVPEEPATPEPEAVPDSPFEQFVLALARVLLERGATRAAANVRGLFGLTPLAPESFDAPVFEALRSRGILERGGLAPTPEFAAIAGAWRTVLEGTASDLSRCGNTTLDAWAAQVLGALVNAPRDRTDDLRRELRKRGVAAFGLLAA